MGHSEQARKALSSAAESLGRRLRFKSANVGASLNPHWWYEAQGDLYYREAKRLIEGAEPKEDPREWSNRGDTLVALGRNEEAIACYERATKLDPACHMALTRKAEVHSRLGDWQNVMRDYERLQSLRPQDAGLKNDLAWSLCTCPDQKYRDYSRSVDLARKAVTLAPDQGNFWNTLAVALYRTDDWASSRKAILKSIELKHANDPIDWLFLAMCECRLEREKPARQLLVHALQRCMVNENRLEGLNEFRDEAVSLIGQPDTTNSVAARGPHLDLVAYTLLLEIEPKAGWIHAGRAVACAYLKQRDQAAADFLHATEIDPGIHIYWYGLAVARLGAGDEDGYRRARAELLRRFRDLRNAAVSIHLCYCCVAVPAEPEEAEAMIRLAECGLVSRPIPARISGALNYRAGRYEAAIADLEKSSLSFPRRAWDWLFLAMAHHKLGHAEEAKKCLKQATEWIEDTNRSELTNSWIGWSEPVEVEQLLNEARVLIH